MSSISVSFRSWVGVTKRPLRLTLIRTLSDRTPLSNARSLFCFQIRPENRRILRQTGDAAARRRRRPTMYGRPEPATLSVFPTRSMMEGFGNGAGAPDMSETFTK